MFHFLTELDERDDYRASLDRCLQPAGYVVVDAFGPDGSTTCSGLPIERTLTMSYRPISPALGLLSTSGRDDENPWDTTQQFNVLQRET